MTLEHQTGHIVMPPDHREGGNMHCFCPSACLSSVRRVHSE